MIEGVKNVILVLSGKGGVGKSTVSTQLALEFHSQGFKVGLLDIDICGPSVPYMLNLEGQSIHASSAGLWVPVYADSDKRLAVMSLAFIGADRNSAVIWRGPKKTGMIRQFLTNVQWEDIDYLIVDTPPGTTDEHITIVESLKDHSSTGAVIVTTPQYVSVEDARREVTFCQKANLAIIGVVENMSQFVCPHCTECTNLFSSGGGSALAETSNVPLLGQLPIDPQLGEVGNTGQSLIKYHPTSPAAPSLKQTAAAILKFFDSTKGK